MEFSLAVAVVIVDRLMDIIALRAARMLESRCSILELHAGHHPFSQKPALIDNSSLKLHDR